MEAIQGKKLEILYAVFKSEDGLSWNELSEMLNELISLSNNKHKSIDLSDTQITDLAIEYASQFKINNKPIASSEIIGYAVRDFFAGYKASLSNR